MHDLMSRFVRRLRSRGGSARRSALAVLLAAVPILGHGGSANAHGFAHEPVASGLGGVAGSMPDGVADLALDAAAACTDAEAADQNDALTLSALGGGEAAPLLLAVASLSIESLLEREGPGTHFRPRGVRTACRAAPTRSSLKPEAPRFRRLALAHSAYREALVAACAGVVPSFSTSVPPPSQSF